MNMKPVVPLFVIALFAACSSSTKSSNAAAPFNCYEDLSSDGNICYCLQNGSSKKPDPGAKPVDSCDNFASDVGSPAAYCCLSSWGSSSTTWPSTDGHCDCEAFSCFQNATTCECSYDLGPTSLKNSQSVSSCSIPAGGHACADTVNLPFCVTTTDECGVGDAILATTEVVSCDMTILPQTCSSPSSVEAQSCDLASSGGGGGTCTSGPGLCKNGDSSTCGCATSCQRVCATCDYDCMRNCSTDSQCSDLLDSSGNPLICSTCPQGVCNAGFSACDAKR